MPEEKLLALTPRDFARMARAVRRVEGLDADRPQPLPRHWGAEGFLQYLCKNTGTTWAKGSTRDVNIYTGATQGSETDSGETLKAVYNRMGDIPANAWIYVFPVNDDKFEVWNATC
jgi:hypothetical protein